MESVQNKSLEKTRQYAREQFKRTGWPTPKTEEYRYTPIARMIAKHFSEQEKTARSPSHYNAIDTLPLTEVSRHRLVFINGTFSKKLSSWKELTHKLNINTLEEAATIHPELIDEHFGKYEDGKDPFALFNSAEWQDGVLIHIPKNTIVEEPIVILNLYDTRQNKIAAHTKLLIVAEPHSQINIVERTVSLGEHPVFSTLNEEIVIQKNASLSYCKIQDDKELVHNVVNTYIHQSDNSRITTHTFTLSGQLIRNNLNVQIDGTACRSDLYGLYLLRNTTLADNHSTVDHKEPGSVSNELYKGIMNEKSKGVFNGKIYVRSRAQQTNAFQSNKNILLSENATLHAKPQLEIWADDVKCSHGCTSGQLDSEALFYLRSRGISKSMSQALLLHAFASEITDSLVNHNLKKIIHKHISDQLFHHGFGI